MNGVSVFSSTVCSLGEGLLKISGALLWVDITKSLLHIQWLQGGCKEFILPEQVSSIWKVVDNIAFLISESGVCSFHLKTRQWKVVSPLPLGDSKEIMRANDGGELSTNFYLYGTMLKQPNRIAGSLYLTNGDKTKKVFSPIGIPNTFIKLNESQILISDSYERIVYKFDFNVGAGQVRKNDIWLDLRNKSFTPDGGCIDSSGNIYIAMWDGYSINKYDAEANLIKRYLLPVPRPTNCVLSKDENSLYITTAQEGLSYDMLKNHPESGSVLKLDLIG